MDREEMIRILEEIIRDPATNPTARCTAIRTLKEFPEPPVKDESLYGGDVLPLTGRGRRPGGGDQAAEAPSDN